MSTITSKQIPQRKPTRRVTEYFSVELGRFVEEDSSIFVSNMLVVLKNEMLRFIIPNDRTFLQVKLLVSGPGKSQLCGVSENTPNLGARRARRILGTCPRGIELEASPTVFGTYFRQSKPHGFIMDLDQDRLISGPPGSQFNDRCSADGTIVGSLDGRPQRFYSDGRPYSEHWRTSFLGEAIGISDDGKVVIGTCGVELRYWVKGPRDDFSSPAQAFSDEGQESVMALSRDRRMALVSKEYGELSCMKLNDGRFSLNGIFSDGIRYDSLFVNNSRTIVVQNQKVIKNGAASLSDEFENVFRTRLPHECVRVYDYEEVELSQCDATLTYALVRLPNGERKLFVRIDW